MNSLSILSAKRLLKMVIASLLLCAATAEAVCDYCAASYMNMAYNAMLQWYDDETPSTTEQQETNDFYEVMIEQAQDNLLTYLQSDLAPGSCSCPGGEPEINSWPEPTDMLPEHRNSD
jgi:hypothetical protein